MGRDEGEGGEGGGARKAWRGLRVYTTWPILSPRHNSLGICREKFRLDPTLFSFFFFFFAKKVSFLAAQLNQPGRSNSIPVSEKGEEEGEREGGYN